MAEGRSLLTFFLVLALASSALAHHQPRTLAVDLQVEGANVSLVQLAVDLNPPPRYADPGAGYHLELLGPDGGVILRVNFTVPAGAALLPKKEWFDPTTGKQVYTPGPGEAAGPIPSPPNRANVSLRVPWWGNATHLRVLGPEGREALRVNLSDSICRPDRACGPGENALLCPADCPVGGRDDLCQPLADNKCDSDCVLGGPWDQDCGPTPEEEKKVAELERAIRENGTIPPELLPSPASALPPASPSPTPKPKGWFGLPGFEVLLAIVALVLVALAAGRRR